jgi:hypothetical protein
MNDAVPPALARRTMLKGLAASGAIAVAGFPAIA